MATVRWLGFSLEHEVGSASLGSLGMELRQVNGKIALPNRFRLTAEATPEGRTALVKFDVIVVGDQTYINLLGQWVPTQSASLPFDFKDLGKTLGDIMLAMQGPAYSGVGVVEGVNSFQVRGSLPSESLAMLVPNVSPGLTVGIVLWIGREDPLVYRARVEGPLFADDQANVVRLLTLRDFDVPVEIQPPVP